jgi:hypothetical protein
VGLEPSGAVGDGGGVVCLMAHGMRLKVVGAKNLLEIKTIKSRVTTIISQHCKTCLSPHTCVNKK